MGFAPASLRDVHRPSNLFCLLRPRHLRDTAIFWHIYDIWWANLKYLRDYDANSKSLDSRSHHPPLGHNPHVPGEIPQLYDIPIGMVNRVVYGNTH